MYSLRKFFTAVLSGGLAAFLGLAAPWARATDSPAAGENSAAPYIILKLDDLTNPSPAWDRVTAFLGEKNIKYSIGIIGNSLDRNKASLFDWIKATQSNGMVEFWNHGFDHKQWKDGPKDVYEFKGTGFERQTEHFKRTQMLAKDKLGLTLRAFGAPFNQTDEETKKVLAENPDIKVWLYGDPSANLPGVLVLDRTPMNIENPTFVPNLERLKQEYQNRPNDRDVFVIQGHPNQWDEARFADFVKIIEYLQGEGAIFTTPYGYYLYRRSLEGHSGPRHDASLPPGA